MKYVINSFEMISYYFIWTSMVFWSLYKLFEAQNELFSKDHTLQFSLRRLTPGSPFLDRRKDTSDFEWVCWKYYIQTSWLYLIFQFVISETLRNIGSSTVKYWYMISSMFFISFYMGISQLLIIIIQPITFLVLILCGGKRIAIWVTALTFLTLFSSSNFLTYFWNYFIDQSSKTEQAFLLLIAISWTDLRCISFCLDYIERQEKVTRKVKNTKESNLQTITNLFSYILYLPILCTGPMILYEEFEMSFHNKSKELWTRLKIFIIDMSIFIIYSCLLDLALHYFYFKAMSEKVELIEQLPSTALAGGGLWMIIVFHIIYVIVYGTTSAFARLDNLEAPPTPRCILRIHSNSNLWKYVDVGFYKFMLKYIYKPCITAVCKNKEIPKFVCTEIASFISFLFVYLWHKTSFSILIWSISNYSIIFFEHLGKAISKTAWYKHFKCKFLETGAMEVRFIAFLSSFLLTCTAVSHIYFFGGIAMGNIYAGIFVWPALHNVLLFPLAFYCCCQISMHILHVPSRTDTKKFKVNTD